MTQAPSTDTLARQVAFHLGLPAVFTRGSELRCISAGIWAAIGLCKHCLFGAGGRGVGVKQAIPIRYNDTTYSPGFGDIWI